MTSPTFRCKIRVEHPHDPTIFFEGRKNFSSNQEALDFSQSSYGVSSILLMVVPLRTNTIKNFASDLFFPLTTSALAERTHHIVLKTILIVGYAIFDLVFYLLDW